MPRFTTSDGVSLHFTDEGSGLPILCLAGLTRDGRDFDYVAPHLAGHRVIRLDYRGRGQSDWAPFETYTIEREGQDALELLAHLGLSQVAILGTSRGGLIAMGLAATLPNALIGVALNDIGPEIALDGIAAIMSYLGKPPVWKTLDEAAAARPHVMAGFAGVPEARWREEVGKFYVETDDGLGLTYDPKLRDAVEMSGTQSVPDLWPLYDALSGKPLCVIRGANSDLLTQETYEEMIRRIPDAHGAVVPDRGHVPFLDEPEALAALKAWLAEMA